MKLRSIAAVLLAGFFASPIVVARADQLTTTPWFTTWFSPPTFANSTTEFGGLTSRQVIRTSLGGSQVRLRISNAYGLIPLVIGAAHIASPSGPDSIVTSSDTAFSFTGAATVTIAPGASVVSDPLSFTVQQNADYLVSVYYPSKTGPATAHFYSQHDSYFSVGNNVSSATLPSEGVIPKTKFFISGLDVAGTASDAGVVTMGDSITDGFGATVDTNGGWTDDLSTILAQHAGNAFAIANDGASSSRLLADALSAPGVNLGGLARLDRDVLALPGVRMIFVALGINDLGIGGTSASPTAGDLIAGYNQLVARAHEKNIAVYGATITPSGLLYNPVFEAKRQAINAAIRAGGIFDGVLDFDAAIRDPNAPSQMLAVYDSGDHLHPSSAGYQAMANIIGTNAH